MNKIKWKPQGFMALMNVLIVSSIALVILTSLITTLVWENQVMIESVNADGAYYLAHGCAEEGLLRIRRDTTYTGSNLNIDTNNECSVSISNIGLSYTLVSTGRSYNQNQSIQIKFTINTELGLRDNSDDVYDRNNLNITSWEKI